MSLIVSRSNPCFGSVSAANERRWISIRFGTSTGWESCEKDLRVTGAAADLANWATPQMVEKGHEPARGFGGQRAQQRATHKYTTCASLTEAAHRRGMSASAT